MQSFSKRRPPNFSNPPDFTSALSFAANSFSSRYAPGSPWTNSSKSSNSSNESYNAWSPNYTGYAQQETPFSAYPWSTNASMNHFGRRSSTSFDEILNRFQKQTLNQGTGPYSADLSVFANSGSAFDYNNNYKPLNAPRSTYRPPRMRRRVPSCVECVFCKNNGASESDYRGHILKDPEGNIQCPVLRAYNCPICNNGGGAKAHTLRYCPMNRPQGWRNLDPMLEARTHG